MGKSFKNFLKPEVKDKKEIWQNKMLKNNSFNTLFKLKLALIKKSQIQNYFLAYCFKIILITYPSYGRNGQCLFKRAMRN